MKKYLIGMMILSVMIMMNTQIAQAKGNNGKVGAKQEATMVGKKHPVANAKRDGQQGANVNSGRGARKHGMQGANSNSNVGSNRRLEGKEKAIERRLEGKQKAIERRLEGKEKAMQQRAENGVNAGHRGHRGHGKHKRNLNNSDIQQRHSNRGEIINSQANTSNNLKQEKNKRYIKQNGTRNKPARTAK